MQATNTGVFKVDLSNCDREPIHIPNKIQSVGFLIGINPKNLQVTWISDNIENFLQYNYQDILGHSLHEFISARYIKMIRDAVSKQNWTKLNPLNLHFNQKEKNDAKFQTVFHVSEDTLLMECVPHDPVQSTDYTPFYQFIHRTLNKIQPNDTLAEVFHETAEFIKQTTGYDRVMIYRFDKDWNGHVIAEAREEHLEPFFDLHYPSSDIPEPARKLYALNPIRIIADIETPSSVLLNAQANPLEFIDLSQSILRAVSPIHVEYLQNMGVSATMSSSIRVRGKLWGLIACHHYSPYYLDYNQRTLVAYMTNSFAHTLSIMEDAERNEVAMQYTVQERKLLQQILSSKDLLEGLTQSSTNLLSLNTATGAAIYTNQTLSIFGQTPSEVEVHKIIDWLEASQEAPVFHCQSLSKFFPESETFSKFASGVLSIKISEENPDYILWFKPEVINEVTWGENPDKKALIKQQGFRLSPRKSFEKWKQVVKNSAKPWKDYEIQNAHDLRDNILEIAFQNPAPRQKSWAELKTQILDLENLSSHFLEESPSSLSDTQKEIIDNIQQMTKAWQEALKKS